MEDSKEKRWIIQKPDNEGNERDQQNRNQRDKDRDKGQAQWRDNRHGCTDSKDEREDRDDREDRDHGDCSIQVLYN